MSFSVRTGNANDDPAIPFAKDELPAGDREFIDLLVEAYRTEQFDGLEPYYWPGVANGGLSEIALRGVVDLTGDLMSDYEVARLETIAVQLPSHDRLVAAFRYTLVVEWEKGPGVIFVTLGDVEGERYVLGWFVRRYFGDELPDINTIRPSASGG